MHGHTNPYQIFVFFFFFFTFVCYAREGNIKFSMNGQAYLYIDKFGFYDQGQANVNVSLSSNTYEAIIFSCNQYAWREVI